MGGDAVEAVVFPPVVVVEEEEEYAVASSLSREEDNPMERGTGSGSANPPSPLFRQGEEVFKGTVTCPPTEGNRDTVMDKPPTPSSPFAALQPPLEKEAEENVKEVLLLKATFLRTALAKSPRAFSTLETMVEEGVPLPLLLLTLTESATSKLDRVAMTDFAAVEGN